ncbi:hypothetical protein [Yellowstone lake phycodnavirus 3]|jgi:hypothetical protein|uniref:hypothetical protein n=1 Tax=Yellowstone lake phycodnavirus 3 TaxID=1586715 RepID=UPI0006EB2BE0|nr:hypothetical protein AR677_gp049 [Yellowstone lake phycodnavirus 3]BAT22548.1 hypothetical protein [Yellowstone lake phycodnavirus 3]
MATWYNYHKFQHARAKEIANRFAANRSITNVKRGINLWKNSLPRLTPAYVGGRSKNEIKHAKLVIRYLKMHLNKLERAKLIGQIWRAESMMPRLRKNFNARR